MGNYSFGGGGVWLGVMILMEALAIYLLVYLIKYIFQNDKEKNPPMYMFDDAFDVND